MTKTNPSALPPVSPQRAYSDTIYRDLPLMASTAPRIERHFPRVRAELPPDERVSNGILLGLGALLPPTVAYSFAQMWNLVSGGTLEHAIRAFFP